MQVCTKSLDEAISLRAHWEGDCHVWTGAQTRGGYGLYGGREAREHGSSLVHRIVWARENGPIPAGMEMDHICRTRNCINIKHLRLADRFLNMSNISETPRSNTGARGVYPTQTGKYMGIVVYRKARHYLGVFPSIESASQAVEQKRAELRVDLA